MDNELKIAIRDLQDVIELIGGRWRLAILAILCDEEMRFGEIQKTLVGITARVLSRELKYLEENLMVKCERNTLSGNSSLYSQTEHAKSLRPVIENLWEWAKDHRKDILATMS